MGSTANDGEPRPQLTRGDQILIHGLAAKPELNGKMGLVQDWIEERGRYTVDIGSILIALRPKNIRKPPRDLKTPVVGASVASAAKVALATPAPQLVAGEAVRIVRLMSKRELNGQEGTVLDWDSSKCRFTVRVASGARYALKRRNLVRSVRTPAKRKRRVHSLPEEGEEGEEGEEDVYEAAEIRAHRLSVDANGQSVSEFLVRWKGYTWEDDTWEPKENILDKALITEFEQRQSAAGHKRVKEQMARKPKLCKGSRLVKL
mmetsp:Transcript_40730/g.67651  ORF Transcript_40730/g.67651 Transcript_40730/m.67651 type:complete len:261 (-) Transcript_40730:195-977(-)